MSLPLPISKDGMPLNGNLFYQQDANEPKFDVWLPNPLLKHFTGKHRGKPRPKLGQAYVPSMLSLRGKKSSP
jgi:hypothetical protein